MAHPPIWTVYGLRVRSRYPLPFPATAAAPAFDLEVHHQEGIAQPEAVPVAPTFSWGEQDGHWLLQYLSTQGHVLNFRVTRDARAVTVEHSFAEWRDAALALLGPALGAVLHLRGVALLHGAAVAVGDRAILLAGNSSVGKSTLTAALVAEGAAFLSDDLSALDFGGTHTLVRSGYPLLKLATETAGAFGLAATELHPVFLSVPKHGERWLKVEALAGGFRSESAAVRAIYLLAGRRGDLRAPRIEDLSPAKGCLALTEHLYGQAWLRLPRDAILERCARIASSAPVRRVWLPDGLNRVGGAARRLMDDVLRS